MLHVVCSRQSRPRQALQSPSSPQPLPSAKAVGQHPTLGIKILPAICLWVTNSPKTENNKHVQPHVISGDQGPGSHLAGWRLLRVSLSRLQSRCHHPGLPSLEGLQGTTGCASKITHLLAGRLSFLPFEPLCRASPRARDPREFAAKTEAMVSL